MNKIKQAFLHLRDNRGDEHTARMIWVAIAFLTGAILFSVVFASISGPMHNWFDNLNEDLYVDGSDGEYAPGTPGGDYGGSGGGTPDAPVNPPDVDIISSPGLYDHSGMLIYTWDELIARGYLSVFEDILTPGSQVMPAGKLVCKDVIKTVGLYAFANQTNLTSIFLGDSVVYISENAFSGLSTLSSVRLPASLAYIGADAFTNCTNLSNITYGGTQVQWRAINKEAGWNAGMPHYAVHCVDGSIYPIILQLIENATITPNYPTDVGHGEQAELFFTAMNDYSLPATITVLGAEYTWDLVSGKLTITNPSDFVYVYISGEKTGCRVVFDANTGTVDPTFKRVVYNLPYGTLPTPVKTGYNFVGWFTAKTGGSEVTAASLVSERNDHTVYAHWTPKTDTPYTVHHYYMNLDGSYPSTGEVQSLKGTTDATVTPAVIGKTGFTSPTTQTVTIKPDGSTVVKYYYTRNQYTVSLNKGTGITGVSGAGTYYYGETVTINATVKTGYTWKNWNGTVTSNTQKYMFTMPANNLNLTANATARTDITYTVYHYYMGLDGKYPATGEAMTYTGTTDTQVTAPLRGKTGFTSPSEQKVTINGDGSTVVHYKYERQKFTLTLDKTTGITQVTGAGTYYYGASVTVSRTVAAGYNWTKWTGSAAGTSFDSTSATYTFTMPAANFTLKANATARTDTTYKVNHYYMGLDGKYSTPTTQTFTGTTDTNVTPAVVGQTGFTSPATQTVKINGNGTTVVDYYYTRNQYTVTLTKGTGISAVTGANKYYYGATVVINATVTDGYRWNNWTGTFTETTQRYSFAMPANDVSLTANATIRNDVPYTVYHYYMNLDGTYPTTGEVQNYTGTTNASVTPPLLGKTGFTSPATQTVTIKGDGSTVVKYYYSRNQYTVTVNKGTGVSAVTGGGTYYYGASVTINATMATGYTWGSWSGTHTTTTQKYTFTMPANNVNDTANAKANTYTVVYNGNGNTGGSTANSTHVYDTAKALTANGYTKTGYTFIGWATTDARADAGTVDYADKASVKNLTATAGGTVTLYAVWKANTYTVVYNGNGNTGGSTASSSHTYNVAKALTANGFTNDGYSFIGWATTEARADAGTVDYADKASVKNLTATSGGTVTLYAVWKANTYYVVFDANGGTNAPPNQAFVFNSGTKLTTAIPTRTGYTFVKWVSNPNNRDFAPGDTIPNGWGGFTLIAQWKVNPYTLVIDKNDGSAVTTITQNYGSTYTVPTPTRNGYTFAGWTLTGGGTWDGSAYTFGTANGTLTANWTATSYTITYTNPMGLPSGYTPLEYIESTGTQYIDTGYVAPNGYMADVQFAYMATNPGSYIIGSHNTGAPYGRNGFGITGTGYWELGTGDTCPQSSAGPAVGTIYVANISTVKGFSSVSLNGQTILRTSDSTSRSSHNVLLFYEQYGQYHGGKSAQARIYYAKIYDTDGTLVRDFIPCKNASGTIGMYDLVAGKFYGNAGSGTFVAGPAKWPTSSTYNINTNLVAPTAPYKNAYAFTGWKVTSAVGNWTTGKSYRGDVTIGTGKYGNVTLEATWVKNNMTLTVNPNGGTWEGSTATQKFVQKYGSSIAISTPTRPGYTFAGWTIDNSGMCSGTHYVFGPNPATLTAQWTPNTYTLNYITPVAGTSSTNISGIVPNGYTILEYIVSNGTQYIDTGFVPNSNSRIVITGNVHSAHSLYGTSESGNNFNLTSNGSTVYYYWNGAGASPQWSYMNQVHTYEQDKNVCKIDGATVHTYANSSWAATTTVLLFARNHQTVGPNDMGNVRVHSCKLYDNGVLVRNFIPCKNASGTIGMYDLVEGKFYTNKGTGTFTAGPTIGSSTTITYTPETSLTINAAPSATGYTFGGWKVQSSTDGSWTNGATFSGSQSLGTGKYGNAVLVAQWTINSYTLTVNPNGGSWNGSTSSQTATQNYKTTKSIPNPTRTGYTFTGWSLSGGGSLSGTTYTYGAGNATLTANWTPNVYKVTLDNQSASVSGTTAYYYQFNTTKTISGVTCYYYGDSACTLPLANGYYITVPKKAGYVFGGYYTGTNGSGTQYVDSTGQCVNNLFQSVAGNTTLYAKWTASTYTYAYNANGGSGSIANQTPAWDTSFTLSSGFSRTGWTFNGYYVQRSTDGRWVSTGGWATEAEMSANGWTKSYYQPGEQHSINSSWVDPYIGSVTFTFYAQWTAIPYTLDINGLWDGVVQGGLADRGTFDIYINGTLVGNDVTDYYNPSMTYGDTYQVTDVKRQSAAYQRYAAQDIGAQSGSITGDTNVMLSFVPAYYTITSKATYDSTWHTSSDTGNMEHTYIGINGTEMPDAARVTFANSNPTDIWTYPYGTAIVVAVSDKYDNDGGAHSYITWNGSMVAGKASYTDYAFVLSSDIVIDMEYNAWLTGAHWDLNEVRVAYWNCYITSTERDYYVP